MMDTTVDYYAVLGVPITANRSEVKTAWSELVQKYHPDMGADADATKFMGVQKAYEVLTDEKKRLEYDRARDAMNPPARPDVKEDYTPGWGEDATTSPGAPAAAPVTPSTAKKAGARDWIPPHMRTKPANSPPPSASKQGTVEEGPKKASARSKVHKSWRTVADPSLKPRATRDWKVLWLPPVIVGFVSLITGLVSFSFTGEGIMGAITPAYVIILMCSAVTGVILDWSRIQSGRDSSLGVAISGVVALGATVIGFGTENHWLTATGILTALWGTYLFSSLRYKYVTTRQIPVKQLRQFVAYGKPGRHAPSNIGQLVEQDLADKLEELLQIPSLRLFHGLFVPATRGNVKAGEAVATKYGTSVVNGSYIGQAVTAGKKVAFLTSVVWPAGDYTVDSYGGVLIDGQHTKYELDDVEEDFRNWQSRLKGSAEVRMFLVVHADGPTSFDTPDRNVELVSAHNVVDTLGSWLVDDQDSLDREVNSTIAEHLATT